MDTRNRFHTPETWLWVRAEHVALVTIDRADFAISPHVPAAVVGEKIEIHLDIQASLGS